MNTHFHPAMPRTPFQRRQESTRLHGAAIAQQQRFATKRRLSLGCIVAGKPECEVKNDGGGGGGGGGGPAGKGAAKNRTEEAGRSVMRCHESGTNAVATVRDPRAP